MLSKCANPICFARLRSLRQGKIFNVEMHGSGDLARRGGRVEHFWLCEDCARVLTLVYVDGQVRTRPLRLALRTGAGS